MDLLGKFTFYLQDMLKRLSRILDFFLLDKETKNLQELNKIREEFNELMPKLKDVVLERRMIKLDILMIRAMKIKTKRHKDKVALFMKGGSILRNAYHKELSKKLAKKQ